MPRARITRDIYVIQANYGYGDGWEDVNTEEDRANGRRSLKEYRTNAPGQYRLIKRRERIEQTNS